MKSIATITLYDDGTYTANPPFAVSPPPPPPPPPPPAKPFTVAGTQIIDGNGKPFVPQGINHMAFGNFKVADLDLIANTGANSIRWALNPLFGEGMTTQKRQALAEKTLARKMIPILCDGFGDKAHPDLQTTGSTDPLPLRNAVTRWVADAPWLKDRPEVIVNIANEWGPDGFVKVGNVWTQNNTVWRDEYVAAVQKIRAAGINNLLLIDTGNRVAPGQCPVTVQTWGKDILNADPLHNVAFSIHMYNQWFTESPTEAADLAKFPGTRWDVRTELAKTQAMGLAVIVGEFTSQKYTNPNVYYDPALIMKACNDLRVGWCAWSWANNKNSWADMWWVDPADGQGKLKQFGIDVVNGPNGLKATAKRFS